MSATSPTSPNANLAVLAQETSARYPDHRAVILDDAHLTYAALEDACGRMATWLAERGIGAGDRVALMLPNLPSFPVIYFGILRLGAVVVPMNPLFKVREISYYLKDSGATIIFAMPGDEVANAAAAVGATFVPVGPSVAELIAACEPRREIAVRTPEDTAVILYTSGTTGSPKGAELTHHNLVSNQRTAGTTLLLMTPDDVVMGCLPLFHVFGMTVAMNTAFAVGASLTLVPRFDPVKALEVIARDRVTIFEGVPTMYGALLAAATDSADLSSLRVCISGGASLPVELLRGFEARFGAEILEGYGLSETSPAASFNHPGHRKPGSIGYAIAGVEMRVVGEDGTEVPTGEVGEIVIRGENIMRGYWNKPEETANAIRDGWFHSGDLARRDEDGFFFIVDRIKDMILRGGLNVYPREIEELLYEHPAVAEAAVVGVPDAKLGEEIAAYVVLKPGAQATEDELREHVKSQVAAYKYPRTIKIIDVLPKGATGKILKRELREEPV